MPTAKARPPLAPQPDLSAVGRDLLAWYDGHRRVLPWRALPGEVPDPYRVWLSEIMLQQTTVRAVVPFYAAFLHRWPTVTDLAAAPIAEVMHAWAGLGYYSRARNLHACAIAVAQRHGGRFPDTEACLRGLPGIGSYTAAAIAAIAFGRDAVVVDGNVERVMIRLHGVTTPLPAAKRAVAPLMRQETPSSRAGDFAQAVMDLGATICTPRNPACAICAVRPHCAAARHGIQGELPRRQGKKATPVRHGVAYLVQRGDGKILVRTREPKGLLGGMTEIPGTPWTAIDEPPPSPTLQAGETLAGLVTHVFTHFTLHLDVVRRSTVPDGLPAECRWITATEIQKEALPTLMRNVVALGLPQLAQRVTLQAPPSASRKRHRNSP